MLLVHYKATHWLIAQVIVHLTPDRQLSREEGALH